MNGTFREFRRAVHDAHPGKRFTTAELQRLYAASPNGHHESESDRSASDAAIIAAAHEAQEQNREAQEQKRKELSEARSRSNKEGWARRREAEARKMQELTACAPEMWKALDRLVFGYVMEAWEIAVDVHATVEGHLTMRELRELEAEIARMSAATEMLAALRESRRVHQNIVDNLDRRTTEGMMVKDAIKTIDKAIAKAVERVVRDD